MAVVLDGMCYELAHSDQLVDVAAIVLAVLLAAEEVDTDATIRLVDLSEGKQTFGGGRLSCRLDLLAEEDVRLFVGVVARGCCLQGELTLTWPEQFVALQGWHGLAGFHVGFEIQWSPSSPIIRLGVEGLLLLVVAVGDVHADKYNNFQ